MPLSSDSFWQLHLKKYVTIALLVFTLVIAWRGFNQTITINPLQLTQLNGDSLQLPHPQKKLTLVNFWSVHCPPCRLELPQLQAKYTENKQTIWQQLQVVTIVMPSDNLHEVIQFKQAIDLTLPIAIDINSKAVAGFNHKMITPSHHLLDNQGNVLFQQYGAMDIDDLQKIINRYL